MNVPSRWEDYAACYGNHEPFMDDDNAEAINICWTRCRVRPQCLLDAIRSESGAIDRSYLGTIRGGFTPLERWRIIKYEVPLDQL